MAGKPPTARDGKPEAFAGRPVVAGIAPFSRELSPRASESDLWSAIEASVASPDGLKRMKRVHGVAIDKREAARARSFISQARQYYGGIGPLAPVAKPLVAYYFVLNLTKAFLTVAAPNTTATPKIFHGLTQDVTQGTNYSFKREQFIVQAHGVFRLLATRTGMKHCWAKGHAIALHQLMPCLADGYAAYADATGSAPKLLPIEAAHVLFGAKRAWIRIEVDRNVLRQRNLRPTRLLSEARIFGDRFRLVNTSEPSASFESKESFLYAKRRSEVFGDLCQLYDSTLIACDRSFLGNRLYLVLSKRPELLSHEAVTFAVMHHLSNLVRYRPGDGEKLLNSPRGWLLRSWVDRASETFLLNIASRITGENHVMI